MKDPKDMDDPELLKVYALYCELESKGVGDEVYISRLEDELAKREGKAKRIPSWNDEMIALEKRPNTKEVKDE